MTDPLNKDKIQDGLERSNQEGLSLKELLQKIEKTLEASAQHNTSFAENPEYGKYYTENFKGRWPKLAQICEQQQRLIHPDAVEKANHYKPK